MARPSQQINLALLASGRALYPRLGGAGLTVRALAEHAGVNPAMFHYHFGSKEEFLRALLRRMYEEMYGQLSARALTGGPALERLRQALLGMAIFAREHRPLIARLLTDTINGEPVAARFLRENGPRHVGILHLLLEQGVKEGALRDLPRLQQLSLLMGSVLLPVVFISGLFDALATPLLPAGLFSEQVMTDAAIEQRIALAIAALSATRGSAKRKRAP